MKSCVRAFVAALLVGAALLPAEAAYRFDDVYKPSGVGAQWMVITGSGTTVGNYTVDPYTGDANPLQASGDITQDRESVRVMNGNTEGEEPEGDERAIDTMFMVIPENQGQLTVDFYARYPDPSSELSTVDVLSGLSSYTYPAEKIFVGDVGSTGKRYTLNFYKTGTTRTRGYYGSERGTFIFHQNPRYVPSQTLQVPFVMANVRDGTAEDEPLRLRMTLRNPNTGTRGEIVAYDDFEWDVTDEKRTGGSQWVLVPVDTYPTDTRIPYSLTTEVTNHTGVRYTAQRYDGYTWYPAEPVNWKFDLPRLPRYQDLPRVIYLDPLSHIAPGLTTVYRQSFNVNESEKRVFGLYSVDPASVFRDLILNHYIIYGLDLGSAAGASSTRSYAPYRVQAFNPRTVGTNFLMNVARTMNSAGEVLVPTTQNFFSQSSINEADTNSGYVSGGVIRSFAVKQSIPASLRRNSAEGMLPLHVTFNLPRGDSRVGPYWNELLERWHNAGDIHDLFAKYFSIYLLSRKEGERDNPCDMVQELINLDAYYDDPVLKVFLDEDNEVITVSFIVMLMDGTRDGSRPALYLVEDSSPDARNQFMVVRDGWRDNVWNLVFYVAPSGYTDNYDVKPTPTASSEGSGGCDAGFGALAMTLALGLAWRRTK